ncbi:MAG TPA: hypothetical protein VF727_12680 [Allosphingosinicella sp.]|jgi:hypothetical protein
MRRYLHILALSFLAALALVGGFTRLVDPYDYWGGPQIAGLNRYKPASGKHLQAVKLRQIERLRPRTLLVGNSRVAVGLDPASPAWPRSARPVYNLGLPGAGTDAVVEATIDAMDRTHARAVVFAVEFDDFRVSLRQWRSWNATEAVSPAAGGLREKVEVILSLDALSDSLAALLEQRKANPAHITPQGFDSLAEYNDNVAAEGHAVLFEQRQRDLLARWLGGAKAVRWPGAGGSPDWAALERLAAECRRRRVSLTLVTYPYHVDMLLGFEASGLWPAFEDWRRGLAAFAARAGVPLYDFSGVAPETIEPVPARGDTETHMRWYWEAGHFKAALGERMIADLAAGTPRFGTRLTPGNVGEVLSGQRRALGEYRLARKADAARFDRLFAEVRRASPVAAAIESASR